MVVVRVGIVLLLIDHKGISENFELWLFVWLSSLEFRVGRASGRISNFVGGRTDGTGVAAAAVDSV